LFDFRKRELRGITQSSRFLALARGPVLG
jgi:hypothetical protein